MGEDVIEKLATRGIVKNDTDVLIGFYGLVEANDVWVMERLGGEGVEGSANKKTKKEIK